MNRKGFTIIELTIVVAILAIILGITGAFISSSTSQGSVEDVAIQLVSDLRRAQWQTINGQDDTDWGVHVESNLFVLFKGTTYNPAEPDNFLTYVEGPVTISDISLNGGGVDVTFDDTFGDTTTYGTITLQSTVSEGQIVITINEIGSVDAD